MIIKSTLLQSLGRFKSDLEQLFATKAQASAMDARLIKLETYATEQDIRDLFSSSSGSGALYDSADESIELSAEYAGEVVTLAFDATYDSVTETIEL